MNEGRAAEACLFFYKKSEFLNRRQKIILFSKNFLYNPHKAMPYAGIPA